MTRNIRNNSGDREGYEMPDAPPFGRKEEKKYVEHMKKVRNKVIDLLPISIKQKIWVKKVKKAKKYVESKAKDAICATVNGVIIGPKKNHFSYVFSYKDENDRDKNDKPKEKKGILTKVPPVKILKTRQYAKIMAEYENERHKFVVRYSFVAEKAASAHCKQCHCGMGYDDLCQSGFEAIINVVDKWPPFLGAKDKGARILTSIQVAVNNALRRFLDDFNRKIKVPSYKIEQITVRLRADNILWGKLKKPSTKLCKAESCASCVSRHSKRTVGKREIACRRNKPGRFELSVQKLIRNIYEINDEDPQRLQRAVSNIDGKSLKDFAIHTGRYREVAETVSLDIGSMISILESIVSIDMPISDDNEGTVADMIPYEEYDSEYQEFKRDCLEEALDQITPRNASIIRDHFFGKLSIREISAKYGFSPMRASDLIEKSINQIKANPVAMNILSHKIIGQ